MKKTAASVVLAAVMALSAVTPSGAVGLFSSANIFSPFSLDSKITAGSDLSANDAAMRLYYLGFLTGNGTNINGGIEFSLERGLSRVEAAVFAVRLLGAEEEALLVHYSHPFSDVPDWASDYVGYIYSCGLLEDLVEAAGDMSEIKFSPQLGETAERFMSYMLYALGYRMNEGDYTYFMAAEYARGIGICVTEKDEPLTRADAVVAMYNTLRTTIKGEKRVYSDVLVEKGAINYSDAVFLLWNRNNAEIKEYLDAVGYETCWVLPNGYYKIKEVGSGKQLNIASSGMNSDYEGVPVTLWDPSSDITQTFRIERTERGTYYIYSAASKNGYGRVIGASNSGEASVGLYQPTGRNAIEFNIIGSADGTWRIETASGGLCLGAENRNRNGEEVTLTSGGSMALSWEFTREGTMNSAGEEIAIFVAKSMLLTQGAFDDYSHMTQNAVDIQPAEREVYAPFNAKIVRIDASEIACNAVWIESTSKVRYADGSYDYMTVCFMHDNNISDLYVGQAFTQGEYFYDSGDYGISSGKHVHVAVYRGQYNASMRLGSGDINIEDAMFLPDDTYVYNDYGLDWIVASLAG
ncbi:MAG: RICIN domain-containing protein [Eubacteriales bacterium]